MGCKRGNGIHLKPLWSSKPQQPLASVNQKQSLQQRQGNGRPFCMLSCPLWQCTTEGWQPRRA
eukprot:1143253-Amphidinium_carterae.1